MVEDRGTEHLDVVGDSMQDEIPVSTGSYMPTCHDSVSSQGDRVHDVGSPIAVRHGIDSANIPLSSCSSGKVIDHGNSEFDGGVMQATMRATLPLITTPIGQKIIQMRPTWMLPSSVKTLPILAGF